ncbi:Gp37-like protein, partial [Salinispora vitiensis]
QPITTWTSIEIDRKHNEPAAGLITVPAGPALLTDLYTPGRRAVVLRDGEYFAAGPIERPAEPFAWTADSDGPDTGEITFAFGSDLADIVARVSLPDPTLLPEDPAQPEAWTRTAIGESVLRDLVDANCISTSADTAYRKVPSLALGATAGVGTAITYRTRFEQMGDAMRRAALAAGGLVFDTVQQAGQIHFVVRAPLDRTSEVRYSRSVGNLRGIHLEGEAPTVSDAIVGGGGEGADRLIIRRVSDAAHQWGISERFIDQRQASELVELHQAGDEALAEGAEKAKLMVVVVAGSGQPTPNIGDLVTVELWPGTELAEEVRGDHLEVDAGGELHTLLVGSEEASPDPEWIHEVRRITRSLARLETI